MCGCGFAWGHTALAAFRGGRGGSENRVRVWPRQPQCGRSAKCRHRINYQSIDNWLLSRITARPDAFRSVGRLLRDSSGRISSLSPGRKRVCPDYAGGRLPVILRHQIRKRGHVLRAEASALCLLSAQCPRGTTTLNNAALPSNRFFASMHPTQKRAGRQIEAAGRFSRLRGSTASSKQGARVVDARTSPRLPCIRARQSRLPVSMRERSRGRLGRPANCPSSNDDRSARIRVTRNRAINPRYNRNSLGISSGPDGTRHVFHKTEDM
jgi:hypothetical protein